MYELQDTYNIEDMTTVEKLNNDLLSSIEAAILKLDKIRRRLEDNNLNIKSDDVSLRDAFKCFLMANEKALGETDIMYKACNAITMYPLGPYKESMSITASYYCYKNRIVDGFILNGMIFVKAEILPPKSVRRNRNVSDREFNPYLGYPLEFLMNEIASALNDEQRESFIKNKCVHFVHAYTRARYFVPDTDAHDIKSVLDTICRPLGGDQCIGIYSRSVMESGLPEATYIAISPTIDQAMSSDEILRIWKNRIESGKTEIVMDQKAV